MTRRAAFLDALATTCNVRLAAASTGVRIATIYAQRRRDPAFAEQWREAIEIGYDKLEALLLEHGGAGEPPPTIDPECAEAWADPPPFDFDRALALLRQYRGKRDGLDASRAGRPRRNATREETNAALLKALKAAEKRVRADHDATAGE